MARAEAGPTARAAAARARLPVSLTRTAASRKLPHWPMTLAPPAVERARARWEVGKSSVVSPLSVGRCRHRRVRSVRRALRSSRVILTASAARKLGSLSRCLAALISQPGATGPAAAR